MIYVAEFVNPSLKLTLSPMELKQSISYIKSRARSLGYTFEDHSQNDKKDTDSVLDYTDELDANDIIRELTSSRKLQRGADSLLKFWLEKLGNQSTSGVAYVALEVLSTLCHSASTEREFSKAKNILTYKRLRLLPEITEDLLIIQANPEISTKYIQ